jgi:nitroreductase
MELEEAIKERRSIRKYKDEEVPRKDIERIIELATWAPSGGNRQSWRFIVIEDRDKSKEMADLIREGIDNIKDEYPEYRDRLERAIPYYTFFEEAPVTIAIVATEYPSISARLSDAKSEGGIPLGGLSSVAGAIQNLLLSAHSMGYGTCWMTGPLIVKDALEKYLGVADNEDLVAITPLGVPGENPAPKPRNKDVIEFI